MNCLVKNLGDPWNLGALDLVHPSYKVVTPLIAWHLLILVLLH